MYSKDNYPSRLLEEAVDAISSLPGVGRKSALRLALHLLRQPQENVHHFTAAIDSLRDNVRYCSICRMISDDEICPICSDRTRDRRTICVVENVRDVMSIENTGQYRGLYHVLGGIISPINGIGPSDLTIRELVSRVAGLCGMEEASDGAGSAAGAAGHPEGQRPDMTGHGDVEVILALSGDVEGETTSFYIYRQLEKYSVTVSSLARGLGFGDDLEYADELTLGRSIVNRQLFRP